MEYNQGYIVSFPPNIGLVVENGFLWTSELIIIVAVKKS